MNTQNKLMIEPNVESVGEVYGLKRKIMNTRKELRKEFCDKVWNEEFDSEKLVNRYTLWLEQKIVDLRRESKLHQPTVISAVCSECGGKMVWSELYEKTECESCGCDLAN